MRAMILDAPGQPLRPAEVPVPQPGRGQALIQSKSLRNLPHRSAHPGRRTEGAQAPADHGASGSGRGGEHGRSGQSISRQGNGWACPGWVTLAAVANDASPAGKISATRPRFTGYQIDGGFAEYTVADYRFCFPIPDGYPDLQAAPSALCRADRLSLLEFSGRCRVPGHLRFWRCRCISSPR